MQGDWDVMGCVDLLHYGMGLSPHSLSESFKDLLQIYAQLQ
jgi:hypothetical protein